MKKQYSFYFRNITISDAFYALFFLISEFFPYNFIKVREKELKKEIKKIFDFKKIYLFGSARSSLYSLLKSLKFPKGSEILLTGFTCDAVPNAIINAGYIPVYVDIKKSNYCMNPKKIKNKISSKTKAIIIQHTFGIPAEIDKIIKISKEFNLFTIEDCALSLGSKFKNKFTGTFSDASIFTFELSKSFTTCWGGMLLLNSNKDNVINLMDDFYINVPLQSKKQKIKILFQFTVSAFLYNPSIYILGKYIISIFFKLKIFSPSTSIIEKNAGLPSNYLYRLSDPQVNILYRQFLRFDSYLIKNEKLKNDYIKLFKCFLNDELIKNINSKGVILIRFPILTENRSNIKELFYDENVELGEWFISPISSNEINHELFGYKFGSCHNSEFICKRIINLPLIYDYKRTIINKRLFSNLLKV